MSVLSHQPVLVNEVLAGLAICAEGCYVDATFGRGGHSKAILEQLGPRGTLLALDRDPAAEEYARTTFGSDQRFQFVQARFSQLADVLAERGIGGCINGLLLDLGVSSPQLDDPSRGFSFSRDGQLDMRMDPTSGPSATEWLNRVSQDVLERTLAEFGEERFHRRVARAIVAARRDKPITTTSQLAEVVATAIPSREPGKHPATRAFQAVRIAVNDELAELCAVLPQAVQILAPGGRLAVISFHSLEDRLVKQFMRQQARGRELPANLPVTGEPEGITLRLVGRAVPPTLAEVALNPRARSARLRVAERV